MVKMRRDTELTERSFLAYFANYANKRTSGGNHESPSSAAHAEQKLCGGSGQDIQGAGAPQPSAHGEALLEGPLCVAELQHLVGADMSTVSRHLAVLKSADIVSDEKRGLHVYYSLKLTGLGQFLTSTSAALDKRVQERQAQLTAMMAP